MSKAAQRAGRAKFGVDAERLHRVGERGQHARRGRVGNLHVEHAPVAALEHLLDEGGLADAPATRDAREEPPLAREDVGEVVLLAGPAVETPGPHVAK